MAEVRYKSGELVEPGDIVQCVDTSGGCRLLGDLEYKVSCSLEGAEGKLYLIVDGDPGHWWLSRFRLVRKVPQAAPDSDWQPFDGEFKAGAEYRCKDGVIVVYKQYEETYSNDFPFAAESEFGVMHYNAKGLASIGLDDWTLTHQRRRHAETGEGAKATKDFAEYLRHECEGNPQLAAAVEAECEVIRLQKLVRHMWVHDGYPRNGYTQMTTKQKAMYDAITGADAPDSQPAAVREGVERFATQHVRETYDTLGYCDDAHYTIRDKRFTGGEVVRATDYDALQRRCDSLKNINREWLAANGPGGWIDELRTQLAEAKSELNWYIKAVSDFNDRLRALGHEPGGFVIDGIWVCDELKKAREYVSSSSTRAVAAENKCEELLAEMQDLEGSLDLHTNLNRKVALALGKPLEGPGSSWHDMPECVTKLTAERDALYERYVECKSCGRTVEPSDRECGECVSERTCTNEAYEKLKAERDRLAGELEAVRKAITEHQTAMLKFANQAVFTVNDSLAAGFVSGAYTGWGWARNHIRTMAEKLQAALAPAAGVRG